MTETKSHDTDKRLIIQLFERFYDHCSQKGITLVSDLIVQVDPTHDQPLSLSDDSERVSEIAALTTTGADLTTLLQAAVLQLQSKGYFDRDLFIQPLSVLLRNEDSGEEIELLQLHDEWVGLDLPLMEGLEAELDKFLSRLLAEE